MCHYLIQDSQRWLHEQFCCDSCLEENVGIPLCRPMGLSPNLSYCHVVWWGFVMVWCGVVWCGVVRCGPMVHSFHFGKPYASACITALLKVFASRKQWAFHWPCSHNHSKLYLHWSVSLSLEYITLNNWLSFSLLLSLNYHL